MRKKTWFKIIGVCFTVSLVVGMIGGALTNEYLISYLFGQLTQKQEEELPIVKKVIEHHVYVEDSLTIDAVEKANPSIVRLYATVADAQSRDDAKAVNAVMVTSDGYIVTCDAALNNSLTWYADIEGSIVAADVVDTMQPHGLTYLRIRDAESFFQTVPFAFLEPEQGQQILALTEKGVMSALISHAAEKNIYVIDRQLPQDFTCSPIINLGGELVGIAMQTNDELVGQTRIISAQILEELLAEVVDQ
ncbi:hypothetical protein GF369_00600 [Candidatus Peregrinibacteria bacterium]|nr:hypothetical protein [Candidatus Peregrinibacteria bacterium]